MKYLIVGLGNIGPQYADTRHNIGFKAADALAEGSAAVFSSERYGHVAKLRLRGRQLVVVKPNTLMNLSGKAVNYWMQKEKVALENLLVVTDDISLPFGVQRLRMKGSDGGHNGLRHITETLGTKDFARLRIGVGNDFARGRQVDYVLGEWDEEQRKGLDARVKVAVETVQAFVTMGGARAMTAFNNK